MPILCATEDIPVGCPWRCIRNVLTLLNSDQKSIFSNHCYTGDREATYQWLSSLQHTPAQLCMAKGSAETPWQASKSFSGRSWKKVWGLPCPLCRNGCRAEAAVPDHSSPELWCHHTAGVCAQPCSPLTQTQTDSQFDTGSASSLWSAWWPLYCGWPSYCLWAPFSRSHWLVFWASPQPCVITTNLSDLFTEPGVNSVLLWTLFPSPDPLCLDPERWGPGWWVPHAARLVSMLCPDSPALMASHPLLGLTVMLELGVQTGYPQNKGLAPC